ncbi:hypothetical protein OBA39_03735 [Acidimicrobiaceae bacterium]|nr:hypothetical protein [Acidimicrobiaceae bacterium]
MKILSPDILEIRISEYLENLRKKNKFEYFPSVMGVTKEGERMNLGFSCYVLKCAYILNLLSDDDSETKNWSQYINNYQTNIENLPSNSYVDFDYFNSFRNRSGINFIKDTIKDISTSLKIKKFPNINERIETYIRAESKQAISTLYEVKSETKFKYLDFPKTKIEIDNFLENLNWRTPWASGAQFSSLCVFAKTQLEKKHFKEIQPLLIEFIEKLANPNTGAYYLGREPSQQEIINGSMKVITGLDWLNQPIHYPEKLIDLALKVNPDSEGCDLVDIVYVLYKCSEQTNYRKKDIVSYLNNLIDEIYLHFKEEEGGFSYFINKSQTHYYGVKITNGLNVADIHGTILLTWALSMIYNIQEEELVSWKILKP